MRIGTARNTKRRATRVRRDGVRSMILELVLNCVLFAFAVALGVVAAVEDIQFPFPPKTAAGPASDDVNDAFFALSPAFVSGTASHSESVVDFLVDCVSDDILNLILVFLSINRTIWLFIF